MKQHWRLIVGKSRKLFPVSFFLFLSLSSSSSSSFPSSSLSCTDAVSLCFFVFSSFHIPSIFLPFLPSISSADQKKVADDRVSTWKTNVEELRDDVAREKRVPLSEIESRVHEISERAQSNDVLQRELVRQEKELATQQEAAMERMTLEDQEDVDERNETKILQATLDTSYERTSQSIADDRKQRLQLERENAKRRILPPIPRPQPFRPTPQCGPTPGWLLTPEEQDNEILRCLRPLKGRKEVEETNVFVNSIFGGGTGKEPGKSTTITEGCQRMGMNVSYFSVLQRIKAREDLDEDNARKSKFSFYS